MNEGTRSVRNYVADSWACCRRSISILRACSLVHGAMRKLGEMLPPLFLFRSHLSLRARARFLKRLFSRLDSNSSLTSFS